MAQAVTTLQIRGARSTPDITGSHTNMLVRLAETGPEIIRHDADHDDLIARSFHLRRTLEAMRDYVGACVQDTNNSTWATRIDRKYVDDMFSDLIGDVCGSIHTAADTVRQTNQAA